jgi:hypothetical protein
MAVAMNEGMMGLVHQFPTVSKKIVIFGTNDSYFAFLTVVKNQTKSYAGMFFRDTTVVKNRYKMREVFGGGSHLPIFWLG